MIKTLVTDKDIQNYYLLCVFQNSNSMVLFANIRTKRACYLKAYGPCLRSDTRAQN